LDSTSPFPDYNKSGKNKRLFSNTGLHRGADKFLARPGRKQANVSVRMS